MPSRIVDGKAVVADHFTNVANRKCPGLAHVESEIISPIMAREVVDEADDTDKGHQSHGQGVHSDASIWAAGPK